MAVLIFLMPKFISFFPLIINDSYVDLGNLDLGNQILACVFESVITVESEKKFSWLF